MAFYTSPSFFIAVALGIIPAACLGLSERRIAPYGMVASVFMLACLFAQSLQAFASFMLFLIISVTSIQLLLRMWKRDNKPLGVYRFCLALCLMPLVVYKVSAAAGPSLLGFIGISYLTFKTIQVLIEIRDGLITEMSFVDTIYFLIFFPTITSGPIDRSRRFLSDVHTPLKRAEYAELLSRGIMLILLGAVMQLVIASVLSNFNMVAPDAGLLNVGNLGLPHGTRALFRSYVYGLYLFFDFAGYSYMAMGVSYCFGIRTPKNFQAPFLAQDMKDFWNRWHITLSFWLRDFVFMRFVRHATKARWFKKRMHTAMMGYILNMGLMGAWHGLSVDYLAYGIYHGILLAVTELYQKKSKFYKRNHKKGWYRLLSWFITLNLVLAGFAIFSGQVHVVVTNLVEGLTNGQ
ncbi:D-alanyl-lipoteichoic acid biosynthesis protein DltB [Collinsella sp. zg1085]|uniref:D-alanyl-lipoteichoic acid biosynthesis protein DltB n=1 Tax=Collinsella sp. zg1085 TaxID=2844380 RepID=UPI001C0E151B|nr:D-alanyl-lipoteichoic acid biosynthesis protein DltB [Collinsella sp. zg1085]QWT17904.1 D-alanyl-lipoteichoic acid biosynthesis protein DltB [Collinsella sp. zg1085]